MIKGLQKKVKLFVEGDTEENYFKWLRKDNSVEIVYKEVNMKGGGYSNFLNEIRKSGDLGFIAIFVIVDMDKIDDDRESFNKLLKYCEDKNKSNKVPYFLVGNNKDFEFLHVHIVQSIRGSLHLNILPNNLGIRV